MQFDRTLWGAAFIPNQPPRFPCPRCYFSHGGSLRTSSEDLHIEVPQHVAQQPHLAESFPIFGPRFRLTMRCDVMACGEVVAVSGTVAPWQSVEDGQPGLYTPALFPANFFPAPPIIAASDAQDGRSGELLEKSFELFWIDPASCMNCIRTFIEVTLDNFGIASSVTTKSGKEKRLILDTRIQHFLETDEHVAESFQPLRKVGNMGSHGGPIDRETMLDAYELLDDCLRHLYDLSPVERLRIQTSSNSRIPSLRAKLRELE